MAERNQSVPEDRRMQVGANSRSWLYRYGWHGRLREMGLGSTGDIGLAVARDRAIDARRAPESSQGSGEDRGGARELCGFL
jgi:hypothetical protein